MMHNFRIVNLPADNFPASIYCEGVRYWGSHNHLLNMRMDRAIIGTWPGLSGIMVNTGQTAIVSNIEDSSLSG